MAEFDRLGANAYQMLKPKSIAFDELYVPSGVTLEQVQNAADCRCQAKPMALAYLHKGRGLWRSAELRSQYTDEKLADDIMLLKAVVKEGEKLIVYSARESNGDSSKHGTEYQKLYKFVEKKFYNLSSKMKIQRAFE